MRHDVVETRSAHIVLERRGAAGVDDLDPERLRRLQRPGDMVADRAGAGAVAHQGEPEIVVAENGEDRLVDDRRVGELEMRVQGVMRRNRRLDHGGEAHLGVEPPGLEGRPARVRQRRRRGAGAWARCCSGSSSRAVFTLAPAMWEWMSMAPAMTMQRRRRMFRRRAPSGGRGDDAIVAQPEIADPVAAMRGIEDAAAGDLRQHGGSPRRAGCGEGLGDAARRRAGRSPRPKFRRVGS